MKAFSFPVKTGFIFLLAIIILLLLIAIVISIIIPGVNNPINLIVSIIPTIKLPSFS